MVDTETRRQAVCRKSSLITGFLALALLGCSPVLRSENRAEIRPKTRTLPDSGETAFRGAAAGIPAAVVESPYRNPAAMEGGVQVVATAFSSRRYAPIIVQAGIPVRWTITMAPGSLNGYNAAMVVRSLNIRQRLQVGETVVEFTPTETGTLAYSCWMGMIRSVITVVDDLYSGAAGAGAAL
jgi:hypothetical protein